MLDDQRPRALLQGCMIKVRRSVLRRDDAFSKGIALLMPMHLWAYKMLGIVILQTVTEHRRPR